jgi:hypothetical protein
MSFSHSHISSHLISSHLISSHLISSLFLHFLQTEKKRKTKNKFFFWEMKWRRMRAELPIKLMHEYSIIQYRHLFLCERYLYIFVSEIWSQKLRSDWMWNLSFCFLFVIKKKLNVCFSNASVDRKIDKSIDWYPSIHQSITSSAIFIYSYPIISYNSIDKIQFIFWDMINFEDEVLWENKLMKTIISQFYG